jgi:hypothetical protein
MAWAYHRMTFSKRYKNIVSSRDYEYARILSSYPRSEADKKKMRNNRKPLSEDQRKIKKEQNTGEKNPMYGSNNYTKWIEKYGEEVALKKLNEWKENKRGIEPWNKGFKKCFSEEALRKISIMSKGKNNPMYGKKHSKDAIKKMKSREFSEETRKKMRDNHANVDKENNPMYGSSFIWINKDGKNKRGQKENIPSLIEEGWNIGYLKRKKTS